MKIDLAKWSHVNHGYRSTIHANTICYENDLNFTIMVLIIIIKLKLGGFGLG